MKRIAVTGASGFLGSTLLKNLSQDFQVIGLSREIRSGAQNARRFAEFWQKSLLPGSGQIEALVNCAAVTDVRDCENNPETAIEINGLLAGVLADICADSGIFMIHISTDAVYGTHPSPVSESFPASPLSAYGKSKLVGDELVAISKNSLVLRANFFGPNPGGKSVFDYFRSSECNQHPKIGFENVFTSSVYIGTLVRNIRRAINLRSQDRPGGVLNLGSSNSMSKYEFGKKITSILNLEPPKKGIYLAPFLEESQEYNLSMNSGLAKEHGFHVPSMESEVVRALKNVE